MDLDFITACSHGKLLEIEEVPPRAESRRFDCAPVNDLSRHSRRIHPQATYPCSEINPCASPWRAGDHRNLRVPASIRFKIYKWSNKSHAGTFYLSNVYHLVMLAKGHG